VDDRLASDRVTKSVGEAIDFGFTASYRDTKCKIIVSSVAESRNVSTWSDLVGRALQLAAGREVRFDYAFRLGRFSADIPARPIHVG
jgi:hypothetical protein